MKTDDVILKWMQRIWLFVFTPLMATIFFGVFYFRGMEGGLLGLWTRPIFKLAAWPIGGLFSLVAGNYLRWAPSDSLLIDFFVLVIEPALGMIQWFLFVPWLFKKWSLEARQRFWVAWFVSIPVALLIWLVLWLSS